jgi:hypothetical protein
MSFIYSSFFSYRRNSNDTNFIYNLRNIIQSEGTYATNYSNVFFDEKCIGLGNEFDQKIYDSIIKSCSFTLIFSPHYINDKNNWCAKELYRAIKFENYIREKIENKNFSFIFPFIHRGTTNDLPKSIDSKNAITLQEYSSEINNAAITNYPVTQKFQDFKKRIGDALVANFKLIEDVEFDWKEIENSVAIPSDEELKNWIKEQKLLFRENESKNLPKLT